MGVVQDITAQCLTSLTVILQVRMRLGMLDVDEDCQVALRDALRLRSATFRSVLADDTDCRKAGEATFLVFLWGRCVVFSVNQRKVPGEHDGLVPNVDGLNPHLSKSFTSSFVPETNANQQITPRQHLGSSVREFFLLFTP